MTSSSKGLNKEVGKKIPVWVGQVSKKKIKPMAVNRFTEKGLFKLLSPSVSVTNLATSYFQAGSEILKEVISGSTVFGKRSCS